MKSRLEFETEDIQALAAAVADLLKPVIYGHRKHEADDTVFDKKTLAEYLKVSQSTVNKLVMNKQIPHFKIQQGQSGGVRFFKRDIDKWIQRQTIPEINLYRHRPAA